MPLFQICLGTLCGVTECEVTECAPREMGTRDSIDVRVDGVVVRAVVVPVVCLRFR